ncbi:MAG: hypothetical protein ABI647_02050 [Gemmatimonadota bacterium]
MRVSLEQLRTEMVLGKDLVDAAGRLLLPVGTALTDRHLRYCHMWGIPEAEIAGDEPVEDAPQEITPEAIALSEQTIRPAFRHHDLDHPFMATLFRHCVLANAAKKV